MQQYGGPVKVTVICNEPLELGTFRFGMNVDYKYVNMPKNYVWYETLFHKQLTTLRHRFYM